MAANLQVTTSFESWSNVGLRVYVIEMQTPRRRNIDEPICVLQITTHLQNLPSLENLQLQGNRISELSSETFVGTTDVREISLQSNILESLDFITSSVILTKLTKLDVSLNQLDNLANFVAAPGLEELRMDGQGNKNE